MARFLLAAALLIGGCGSAGPYKSTSGSDTARVDAVLASCSEQAQFHLCTMRVEQVHRLGRGVPVLRQGDAIDVRVYQSLLATGRDLSEDSRVTCTLHHLRPSGQNQPLWFVESFH